MQTGIALKPGTAVAEENGDMLDCLRKADLVLAMTVEPGFGGQKFNKDVCPKIKQLRKLLGAEKRIQVDGGLGPGETVELAAEAGATCIVAGSSCYNSNHPPSKVIQSLREVTEKYAKKR